MTARPVCPEHGRVTDDGGPWPRECTRWSWDEDGTPMPCPALATREDVARALTYGGGRTGYTRQ